jgi:hypothetical protein
LVNLDPLVAAWLMGATTIKLFFKDEHINPNIGAFFFG